MMMIIVITIIIIIIIIIIIFIIIITLFLQLRASESRNGTNLSKEKTLMVNSLIPEKQNKKSGSKISPNFNKIHRGQLFRFQ